MADVALAIAVAGLAVTIAVIAVTVAVHRVVSAITALTAQLINFRLHLQPPPGEVEARNPGSVGG